MKKIFNFKDIAYLKQYAPVEITDEKLENNFESMANSYEKELDKLAYVELIKKTIENMTDLPDKVNKNIFRSIYNENDLDKLAKYYQLSKELAYEDYETTNIWSYFENDQEIYSFDALWDSEVEELRDKGRNIRSLYLLNDLWEMNNNIEWVWINGYGRAEAIEDIKDLYADFEDYIAVAYLENYLSSYDKDDFIDEFKLEEKLANKEEKALIM